MLAMKTTESMIIVSDNAHKRLKVNTLQPYLIIYNLFCYVWKIF